MQIANATFLKFCTVLYQCNPNYIRNLYRKYVAHSNCRHYSSIVNRKSFSYCFDIIDAGQRNNSSWLKQINLKANHKNSIPNFTIKILYIVMLTQ